ncbi:MAG TPA: phosphate uptake regulator PhoU [Candidatus Woesearchaeota archaeon]|nr:phosphate uptake regulator PhoU [Candidatus Woesearchaeota archaeon]
MKRSLIQLNETTYAVTLPSKWVKRNSLKKADSLEVIESGGKIVISAGSQKNAKEKTQIELDLSGSSRKNAWFSITSSYIAGFDIIEMKINRRINKDIEEISQILIGSALLSKSDSHATLICVSEAREDFQEDVLNNLIFRFREHVSSVKDARTPEMKSSFREKDHELNRFIFYSLRALNKRKEEDKTKYLMIYSLEQICDSISDSVARGASLPNWKKLEGIFMEITNLYFSKDPLKTQQIYDMVKESLELAESNYEKEILLKMKETIQILSPYILLFSSSSGSPSG